MATAYSYIRFSSPAQMKGDSLRRQLEAARAYAEAHGLLLDESLQDLGVSGFRGKNADTGALGRFLDLIQSGRVAPGSVLVVESLDRLSRQQIMPALGRLAEIVNAGVDVVTLADGQRYTPTSLNDMSQLIISIAIMSRAHEESRIKSERIRAAWEKKKRLAQEKQVPLSSNCPGWLRLSEDRSHFEVIEERAAVIREIFRLSIEGMGHHRIACWLNERKVPALSRHRGPDTHWGAGTVCRILNGIAVLGGHRSAGTPQEAAVMNYYPAIIDEATYHLAQSRSQSRQAAGKGRKGRFDNLLQHLAVCPECGSAMHYLHRGDERLAVLQCSSHKYAAGCTHRLKPKYQRVENSVWHALTQADISTFIDNGIQDQLGELDRQIEAKCHQAEERRTTQAKLIESFGSAPDIASVTDHIRKLDSQLQALDAEITQLEQQRQLKGQANQNTSASLESLARLREYLGPAGDSERIQIRTRFNQLLKTLINQVIVTQEDDLLKVEVRLKNADNKLISYFHPKGKGQVTQQAIAVERNGVVQVIFHDDLEAAEQLFGRLS